MVDGALPPQESPQVAARLAGLGLDWSSQLWVAIREGERARRTATDTEPTSAGGLKDWIARVGRLREKLGDEGWKPVNNYQIPIAVNPAKTIGVGVLLGDHATAGPDPGPLSKYPKGPKVLEVAARNRTLFSPAEAGRPDLMDDHEYSRLSTWFLVTYRQVIPRCGNDPARALIVSELSLPGGTAGENGGFPQVWLDRIILPASEFPIKREPFDGDEDIPDLFEGM
ncbi:hypothetical protein AB0L25_38815 [Spirillospora sp. NPDC052242]